MKERRAIVIDEPKLSNLTMLERNFITEFDTLSERYYETLYDVFVVLFLSNKEVDPEKAAFKEKYDSVIESAWIIRQWAERNKQLDRFPANYNEVSEAYAIVDKSVLEGLFLREKYHELIESVELFQEVADQSETLLKASGLIRVMSGLLATAQRAIDPNTSSVNQAILLSVK